MIIFLGPKKSGTKFFKKNALFPGTKEFDVFFLVVSSATNRKKQFVRFKQVIWQLLWKL